MIFTYVVKERDSTCDFCGTYFEDSRMSTSYLCDENRKGENRKLEIRELVPYLYPVLLRGVLSLPVFDSRLKFAAKVPIYPKGPLYTTDTHTYNYLMNCFRMLGREIVSHMSGNELLMNRRFIDVNNFFYMPGYKLGPILYCMEIYSLKKQRKDATQFPMFDEFLKSKPSIIV